MATHKWQSALGVVLLTASASALYPTMTLEKSENRSAVVSIKAEGKAFLNQKGRASRTFSGAALTLHGSIAAKGNGGLELDDLAGSLQIGIAYYAITSGSGEVDKKGKIKINAKTDDASKTLELTLHGSTQADSVTFYPKQSKLSSLCFLSVKGKAIVTMPATSISTARSDDDVNKRGIVAIA
jgi:hypothetical protein